jgi:putative nucleotidyltransferase with HDIG domain
MGLSGWWFQDQGELEMRVADCRLLVQQWQREGLFDLLLPEVAALRGVPQPEEFHAEGDVLIHTMLALDTLDADDDARIYWGVLFHDIGKATTTTFVRGRLSAHGHAKAGAALVPAIMERIGYPGLATEVSWLVREHHFHFGWDVREDGRLTRQQRRFMEHPLFPLLLQLCLADAMGSLGASVKKRKILLVAELYEEEVAGEKGTLG